MLKRVFDLLFAVPALLLLSPIFLIVGVFIVAEDGFPVFYLQERIGFRQTKFRIIKFRTMYRNSAGKGLLTVGGRDKRITQIGYYLRKYKIDEFPQLINVIVGNMSLVGPRPEVEQYTRLYSDEQKKVFSVKPGITDYASIVYADENELLGQSAEPEQTYIQEIMPAKLTLNLKYVAEKNLYTDLKIITQTILRIIGLK